MSFFDAQGDCTNFEPMFDQVTRHGFQLFKLGVGIAKPTIRNIQSARAQAALQRAAEQMQQQNQSPDSPAQNPGVKPPVWATPDLSLPPLRKK